MANPQPTDAHLRIAHEISEQLMVSHFTAKQRRILDLVLRLSWGCGKKQARIPRQRDFEVVGIGEGHIKNELDVLERDHVIVRKDDEYSFNKDFDQWRVSRARGYDQQKLTALVRLNLNHKVENLPIREGPTYHNGKKPLTEIVSSPDTESATPIEILNKDNVKDLISIDGVFKRYEETIGEPDEGRRRELRSCVRNFGADIVCSAITRAADDGEKTWSHVYTILHANDDRYVKGRQR